MVNEYDLQLLDDFYYQEEFYELLPFFLDEYGLNQLSDDMELIQKIYAEVYAEFGYIPWCEDGTDYLITQSIVDQYLNENDI